MSNVDKSRQQESIRRVRDFMYVFERCVAGQKIICTTGAVTALLAADVRELLALVEETDWVEAGMERYRARLKAIAPSSTALALPPVDPECPSHCSAADLRRWGDAMTRLETKEIGALLICYADAWARETATLSATASASPDEVSMPKAWVEAAQCGNCGGQGWKAIQVEAGVFEQEQCQWCYERWLALGQPSPNDIKGQR